MLFEFVRHRHSDLMIAVNSSKKGILNLEDDDWENDRVIPYLTRFNTYET